MDYTLIEYPEHVFGIKEIEALSKVIDIEMAKLGIEIDNMKLDTAIKTATIRGIERREKVLKIVPLDTQSLEDRRDVVLSRYSDRAEYTEQYLRKHLDNLFESDMYILTIDYEQQYLNFRCTLKSKTKFELANRLIEKITPLHVRTDCSLLYNTWSIVSSSRTWGDLSHDEWDHWKQDVL